MKGLRFLKHSVSMLVRNWKDVLKIFTVPYAGLLLLGGISIYQMGGFGVGGFEAEVGAPESGFLITRILLVALVWVFVTLWTAVAWHRFILLTESPSGFVPQIRIKNMFGYFLRVALIVISLVIPVVLVGYFMVSFLGGLVHDGQFLAAAIISGGISIVFTTVFYMMSPILPAIAIGEDLDLSDAMGAVADDFRAVLTSVFLLVVVTALLQEASVLMSSVVPMLGAVFEVLVNVAYGLITISLMTTIYGHCIQGRDL